MSAGKALQKRRKFAILIGYSGKGFYGIQLNPPFATIEGCLFNAFIKSGVCTQQDAERPSKTMYFQRASRTDKGVSAVRQVLSCLVPMNFNEQIPAVNSHLPEKIRVYGAKRVTRFFDSKNACDSRTYAYLMPSYSLAPFEHIIDKDYRLQSDKIEKFNNVLKLYLGTRNFFNYTSQKEFNDSSARRYIMSAECSQPFVREGMEFVVVRIRGQSFMMHQIRKMIGLAIAITRGHCGEDVVELSFAPNRIDIPKAPGLGLILEKLHYDSYNRRYGGDGIHEPLEWDEYSESISDLQENVIYKEIIETELRDNQMMEWLKLLVVHSYSQRESGPNDRILIALHSSRKRKGEEGDEQEGENSECAKHTKIDHDSVSDELSTNAPENTERSEAKDNSS